MSKALSIALNFQQTLPASSMQPATEDEAVIGVWLPMIPAGEFAGNDGRRWVNRDPDAVVAAFTRKLPFDIEHSTHLLGAKGKYAPAIGWIEALENRDGAIWARVVWNSDPQWDIKDKAYAYYSPAFTYDDAGVVKAMRSAGLTNDPNLDLPALNRTEDTSMPISKELAAALGLTETATDADAVAAVNALNTTHQTALNRAQQPDLNKYVPKETYDLALNRATDAEAKLADIHEKDVAALVDDAIDSGKVAPANREMYLGLCRSEQGRAQFAEFMKTAPTIVTNVPTQTPKTPANPPTLDPEELAICRKMGVSKDDYLAIKNNTQEI